MLCLNVIIELYADQTSAPVSLRIKYAGIRARSFNDKDDDCVVAVAVDVVDGGRIDDDDDDEATAVNAVVRDAVNLRPTRGVVGDVTPMNKRNENERNGRKQ